MEFAKQLWTHSPWLRLFVVVTLVGVVLVLCSSEPGPPIEKTGARSANDVMESIQSHIPGAGNSLPGKMRRTAGKAVDVADQAVDMTGKAVGMAGRVLDSTIDGKNGTSRRDR